MSGVQHIDNVRAIFTPDSNVELVEVNENFFPNLDQQFPGFKGHILTSQFSFDEAWPTWEIHPVGDEMVFLISGDTDLVLATKDGKESVLRVSNPGEYVIVPKNTWHTARPHQPTTLLFFTPGEGTINALTPGGDPVLYSS